MRSFSKPILAAVLAGALLSSGCAGLDSLLAPSQGSGELSIETVVSGLKEALTVGARNAVARTSRDGGYWEYAAIRIPLPAELEKLAAALRKLGLGERVEAFERKMNEAAEKSARQATPIFLDALKGLTFEDARKILGGGETAATDYFRDKTTEPLRKLFGPIVKEHMEKVGVVALYNQLLGRYLQLPLVSKPSFSLEEYITDQGLRGLFVVIGEEERKIRQDPAARTTDLLRKVFAQR